MKGEPTKLDPRGNPRIKYTLANVDIKGNWFDDGGESEFLSILQEKFQIKAHLSDVDFDLLPLEYPDNHFDTVTSFEVFEHLYNPLFHTRELARVLKPNGRLFLSTPNGRSFRSLVQIITNTRYQYHVNEWSESSIRDMFTISGLTINRLERINTTAGGTITRPFKSGFWIEATK
ncbi:MAG: class I SAM-dependent methyltransferase [bacterium]|nr:class I SAM-dependent methyltransferase [bacterium]